MLDKNIMARVATALLGIPLLVLIIGWGKPWQFYLFILLLTILSLREYFAIVFPDQWTGRVIGVLSGALVALGCVVPGAGGTEVWFSMVVIGVFLTYLFSCGKSDERFKRLAWTITGVVYLGYFLPHFALLYRLQNGREWVFFVLLVIMTGDTAAYVVGRVFGRKKLCPTISPGKTVEGSLGGAVASLGIGFFSGRLLLPSISGFESLLLAFVLGVLGQTGDLFESWIKRAFSVKDSGSVLPGHGGLLDRVDSLIFAAALATHYVRVVHP